MAENIKPSILNKILKSILAGALISTAGVIYLNCPNKIVGAFLFSVGLLGVFLLDANLFTGKIGYVNSKKTILDSMLFLVINLVTAFLIGLLYRLYKGEVSTAFDSRMVKQWYQLLLDGIGCGALIYIATESYKQMKSIIIPIICVAGFILAGFEHSIADAFYFGASSLSWEGLLYLLIVIVGNAIGSLVIRFLQVGINKCIKK